MKYVDTELLEFKNVQSLTGQNKKSWEPIRDVKGVKLFDNVTTIRLINGAKYEKADYIALTFDQEITKKNRLKVDDEIYQINDQAVMGVTNMLILSKVSTND